MESNLTGRLRSTGGPARRRHEAAAIGVYGRRPVRTVSRENGFKAINHEEVHCETRDLSRLTKGWTYLGGISRTFVPLGEQLAAEMMRAAAGLHADAAGAQLGAELHELGLSSTGGASAPARSASKPTKWTDVLARSRPIVATSLSSPLRAGWPVDAILVLLLSHSQRALHAAGASIIELAAAAERERNHPIIRIFGSASRSAATLCLALGGKRRRSMTNK